MIEYAGVTLTEDEVERLIDIAFMVAHKDRILEIIGTEKAAQMREATLRAVGMERTPVKTVTSVLVNHADP